MRTSALIFLFILSLCVSCSTDDDTAMQDQVDTIANRIDTTCENREITGYTGL